jgi:hypothetical protein
VDREGALLRLRAEEGQRCAPFLRFDAYAGRAPLLSLRFDLQVCFAMLNVVLQSRACYSNLDFLAVWLQIDL